MKTKFLDSLDLDGEDFSNQRMINKEIAYQLSRIADVLEKMDNKTKK